MIHKSFVQWEDMNGLRKYPMAEDSTCIDDEGAAVGTDLIIGLSIVTYVTLHRPRVGGIYVGKGLVSVTIVDDIGPVACVTAEKAAGVQDLAMESVRTGVFAKITVGDAAGREERHVFSTYEQTGIHEFCILNAKSSCVVGFVDDKSGATSSGAVGLEFENGVECSVDTSDRSNPIVDIAPSDSLAKALSSGCTPMSLESACVAPVIKSINGVAPNEFGEIAIVLE